MIERLLMQEWYVYIIRCRGSQLYTGITTDVERRLAEHRSNKGARYLRGRGPLKLELKKRVGEKGLALKVERLIKKLPKNKKERLIRSDTDLEKMLRLLNIDAGP